MDSKPFDAAKHITKADTAIALLQDAVESQDPRLIAMALGDIARSNGMSDLARKTGINRQALYHAFGEEGNPTLSTLLATLNALGLKLELKSVQELADV
ncbi:addiction module antidote protein [Alterisphingorhabdus coralli]|uniref:Addiction module antidote protein n=1 Tax=Alterisphingorhabdus coralli TaxID=3071408 RepID=A0AA97F718_9SPHN|nr:addiction module antidote protein [Parasphingorhabdus sp. SCSIO 66989]WOE75121.1 putative addiction module antidote protein [Parasphingorhabdus sp. SCSIO 66989]